MRSHCKDQFWNCWWWIAACEGGDEGHWIETELSFYENSCCLKLQNNYQNMSGVASMLPVPGSQGLWNSPGPTPHTLSGPPNSYLIPLHTSEQNTKCRQLLFSALQTGKFKQRGKGSALPLGLWPLRHYTCRLSPALSCALLSRTGALWRCTQRWGWCLEFKRRADI